MERRVAASPMSSILMTSSPDAMAAPTVRRILFPTDYSRCAEGAYRHAAFLADRFSAELHVLHATGSAPASPTEVDSTGHLKITLADVYEDLGLPVPEPAPNYDLFELIEITETEVDAAPPAEAILDAIQDEEIDLVVIGTHGRSGWRRGMLGSVTETVSRRAPCPVLTVRPLDAEVADRAWPPSRVLLAVDVDLDPDPDAPPVLTPAMRWAAHLAGAYRAALDLVYVAPMPLVPLGTLPGERARAELDRLANAIRDTSDIDLHIETHVREGAPTDTIRAMASETGAHLIVVGTHGYQGIKRTVLGSVAEGVLRTAECPVLIVPNDLDIEMPGAEAAQANTVA